MIEFDIKQLVARFLMKEKTGRAMAKAVEAALRAMNSTIKRGVDIIADVDSMPEWRLDELAWEYNCLYDYSANIAEKRRWIREAIPIYRVYGTVRALYNYLEGVFDEVEVEEYWQYGAASHHFRVTVGGEWTNSKEAWAGRAIEAAKNVRSVLDDIAVGSKCRIAIQSESGILVRIRYPLAGADQFAGTIPQENMVGRQGEGVYVIATDARGYAYAYRMSGTHPQENTVGVQVERRIRASPEDAIRPFPYAPCGSGKCGGSGLA